jgi:hypothetical protein
MARIFSSTLFASLSAGALLMGGARLTASSESAQPGLPTGHPSVSLPSKPAAAPALPDDVATIDGIVDAYYAAVSGPKGQPRDWGRFLSLFMPEARFIVSRTVDEEVVPLALTPDEFVKSNNTYFERGGYFESDIHRQTTAFGHIAQVFSTYESKRSLAQADAYARGINSFQLMNTGDRWWITTVMWDSENIDTNPIPQEFLPNIEADDS